MANENKDYISMPTEELTDMLQKDYSGTEPLEIDEIFAICNVLTKRLPPRRTVKEAYREFVEYYLPK